MTLWWAFGLSWTGARKPAGSRQQAEQIVLKNSTIFWDITPCSLLKVNWRFRGTYRLHLQGRKISRTRNQRECRLWAENLKSKVSLLGFVLIPRRLKRCSSETSVHFVRSTRCYIAEDTKTELSITTAERISNSTWRDSCFSRFFSARLYHHCVSTSSYIHTTVFHSMIISVAYTGLWQRENETWTEKCLLHSYSLCLKMPRNCLGYVLRLVHCLLFFIHSIYPFVFLGKMFCEQWITKNVRVAVMRDLF
jgi:hypothetical protein